jgi:hypothetical protein
VFVIHSSFGKHLDLDSLLGTLSTYIGFFLLMVEFKLIV